MSRKEELQKMVDGLREQIEAIDQAEHIDMGKLCVGHYYKRCASYGDYPEAETWWEYSKILPNDDTGFFVALTFRRQDSGFIVIEPRDFLRYTTIIDEAEEITQAEFDKAWNDLLADIAAMRRTASG